MSTTTTYPQVHCSRCSMLLTTPDGRSWGPTGQGHVVSRRAQDGKAIRGYVDIARAQRAKNPLRVMCRRCADEAVAERNAKQQAAMRSGGTFRKVRAGRYENSRYTIQAQAARMDGRPGSHTRRWLVWDKQTGALVGTHPTLARAQELAPKTTKEDNQP